MKQKIISFFLDQEKHWVATLECGHTQHLRHNPPLSDRPWVLSEQGRREKVGCKLNCLICEITS